MRIEDIDSETVSYSKNNFFYSDSYLRKLKLYNTPMEVIQDTFSKCYQVYYNIRYMEYRHHKNSQIFLEKVIDKVEQTSLIRLDKEYPPRKNQKIGLIHILANDKEIDIRWGKKSVTNIPREIEILFNNRELEIAKFLIYTYILQGRRRSITVEECIFYELINILDRDNGLGVKEKLRYRYFRLSMEVPNMLIYMENCKYISILSKNAKKVEDLSISIENKGKRLVLDLHTDYFEILKDSIKTMQAGKTYNKSEYKKILEVLNERD